MRKLGLLLVLSVAACAPRPVPMTQGDPVATTALLALPETQFFVQMDLAEQIAAACPNLAFNNRFQRALIAHRFGAGRRGLQAISQGRAADLEREVATRSLQARYDIDLGDGNLCDVGQGEMSRKSALSAVLLPAS